MNAFFLDSSALVKRYLTETGSGWINRVADPASDNTVVVAAITRVEAAAAIAARQRTRYGISLEERDRLVQLLLRHFDTEYDLVTISMDVLSQAVALTQRYRLRGYDAVQLAAALDAQAALVAGGLPSLTFVSADEDLLAAAVAEGLAVDNPNRHS